MLDHRARAGLRWALALLAAGAALIVPAVAQAATQTASSGGVTATFTYHASANGFTYHDTLTIARGGKVVYSGVPSTPLCRTGCAPGAFQGKSVHVLDLEHNGTRDVVLDLFSGGANCCLFEVVYYPSGSTYRSTRRDFGNQGAVLVDLRHNGRREFRSANPAFTGAFTDDAASGAPIQILTFGHGAFHDVTRSYPKLVAKDASRWLGIYTSMAKQHWSDTEGVIAAWTADEYMLGRKAQAQAYLNQEAKKGHLNSAITNVAGHKYVIALEKFLTKAGY